MGGETLLVFSVPADDTAESINEIAIQKALWDIDFGKINAETLVASSDRADEGLETLRLFLARSYDYLQKNPEPETPKV